MSHNVRFRNSARRLGYGGNKRPPPSSRRKKSPARAEGAAESTVVALDPEDDWIEDFPSYRGLFTYDVGGATFPELGNGVYLWQLEILAGTMVVLEELEGSIVSCTCQMQKRLLDLPEDACVEVQNMQGRFVTEQWYGEANLASRAFRLDRIDIDNPPIETTIDFDSVPVLKRDVLAGCYEFVLSDDEKLLRSVHRSWVEASNLNVNQAMGFMLRASVADPVCPMLLPAQSVDVDAKLLAAKTFLQGTQVYVEGEKRVVNYSVDITRIADINTQFEQFYANVTVTMTYKVDRNDVFAFAMEPTDWKPSWKPDPLEARNATRAEDLSVTHLDPRLVVRDNGPGLGRDVCAVLTTEYSSNYRNEYSLRGFPFDLQALTVEFRLTCEPGVEYICNNENGAVQRWEYQEDNSEWDSVDAWTSLEQDITGTAAVTVNAVVRVSRVFFVYFVRIVAVNALIMTLTLCIYVLDTTDDLADRLGHAFTMLLTAVAYSLVVASALPTLGYLTWLDKYILGTYLYLFNIIGHFTVVGNSILFAPEVAATVDNISLGFNVLALLAMQYYFYSTAQVERENLKKLLAKVEHAEVKQLEAPKLEGIVLDLASAAQMMVLQPAVDAFEEAGEDQRLKTGRSQDSSALPTPGRRVSSSALVGPGGDATGGVRMKTAAKKVALRRSSERTTGGSPPGRLSDRYEEGIAAPASVVRPAPMSSSNVPSGECPPILEDLVLKSPPVPPKDAKKIKAKSSSQPSRQTSRTPLHSRSPSSVSTPAGSDSTTRSQRNSKSEMTEIGYVGSVSSAPSAGATLDQGGGKAPPSSPDKGLKAKGSGQRRQRSMSSGDAEVAKQGRNPVVRVAASLVGR